MNEIPPTPVRTEPVEVLARSSLRQAQDGLSSDRTGLLEYVKTTAALLDLPLDEARAERVAGHLTLSAALARSLEAYPLAPDIEPAEVYCPAPFAAGGDGLRWP